MRFNVHDKDVVMSMIYNTCTYAYKHIDVISSVTQVEVIKWLAFPKSQKEATKQKASATTTQPSPTQREVTVSVNTQRSQRRQCCQGDKPYASVYRNKPMRQLKCNTCTESHFSIVVKDIVIEVMEDVGQFIQLLTTCISIYIDVKM